MVMDWLEWHDLSNDGEFKDTLMLVINEVDDLYLPKELKKLIAKRKREAARDKRRAKRARR